MKKNVASQKIGAQMCSATDGSEFTGSVTVYVTGDAGTQAAGSVGSGACTHEGHGYHTYAPAQAETNYDLVAFTFVGTGAIPTTVQVFTAFPQTGDSFGLIGTAGAGLTNINLPDQTMNITGDITGNLSGSVGSVTGAVGSVVAVVSADITKIGTDTTALTAFKRAVLGNVIGAVGAASTTTSIVTSSLTPAAAVIDQFKGRIVIFDKDTATANLRGQGTDITASTALGVLTVTALTTAPANGDTFTIT